MSRQSTLAHYGLDISISPVPSDYEDSDDEEESTDKTMRPQELLELAVEKRWELSRKDGEDLRRELFQTRLIVNLSIHIEKSKKIFTFNQESTGYLAKPSPSVSAQEFEEPSAKRFKTGN